MNISQQQIDETDRCLSTLPPFTITITDPTEATRMVAAYIYAIAGSKHGSDLLNIGLGVACKSLGIEEGVDAWLSALTEAGKNKLPKFYRPLLIHMLNHVESEHKKEQDNT